MRKTVCASIFLLFFFLCGCAVPAAGSDPTAPPGQADPLVYFNGRVVFVPLEGGFYGLTSAAGENFDPLELADDFRRDGLRVRVKARLLPRSVGTHMWGRKIEILAIERL